VYPLSFETFAPGNEEPALSSSSCHWFVFQGTSILVARKEAMIRIPFLPDLASIGLSAGPALYLGAADGSSCRAVEVPQGQPAPDGWSFEGIRTLFGFISDRFFSVAARALQLLEWDRTHRYCGSCATPTVAKPGERARECPACGLLSYPRISPAAIMAVTRGDTLLLARARRFPTGFYSVLAGFVEPGENLEQCVQREVREETGVEVKNIRYFASQPWPFPHSLMIAFTAEHAAGEIRVDETEILDAGWYTADALPSIPDPISVARRLIDSFVAGRMAR
jgi:NAD+ diphosphatase